VALEHSHVWEFKARFRRHAFVWRSQPAIGRVVEGHRYEITGADIRAASRCTIAAAKRIGIVADARIHVRQILLGDAPGARVVRQFAGPGLERS
jgi:hypothetical protein